MAWFNAAATETSWGGGGWIFSKPWNGDGRYNWGIGFKGDGRLIFRLYGSTTYELTTSDTVSTASWHHVAATVNSSGNMKIYIDGVENATGVHNIIGWTPPSGDLNLNLAMGTLYPYGEGWTGMYGGNPAFSFSFNGTIDSARVWMNKALNQTEIQAEMASSKPVIRPLADLEFEENNGLFANDTHIWVAGMKGTALSFDGIDDYLTIPDSPSLNINKEVTVAAWVKANTWTGTSSPPEDWKKVAGKGQWGSAYHLWSNGGRHIVMTISGTHYSDGSTISLGSWAHIAGVYNTTHIMFYYNGAPTLTIAVPSSLTVNNQPFVIGKDGTTNYYHFNGTIDEVRVFNRTLSPREIAQFYSNP